MDSGSEVTNFFSAVLNHTNLLKCYVKNKILAPANKAYTKLLIIGPWYSWLDEMREICMKKHI